MFNLKTEIRNLSAIFICLLQKHRVLSMQYFCIPFMQKKHDTTLDEKNAIDDIASIYHKTGSVPNKTPVPNRPTFLFMK